MGAQPTAVGHSAEDILDYWFGDLADEWSTPVNRMGMWFERRDATDEHIRDTFGADRDRAVRGELGGWAQSPRGRLALIVLVDQFSRNMFRGRPEAFEHDALALTWCLEGLANGQDRLLKGVERTFFYLPLEHAEDLAMQDKAVACFDALLSEARPPARDFVRTCADYAERHRAIVRRFGRFPHRNATLGRASSTEELAFLEQPGSSF